MKLFGKEIKFNPQTIIIAFIAIVVMVWCGLAIKDGEGGAVVWFALVAGGIALVILVIKPTKPDHIKKADRFHRERPSDPPQTGPNLGQQARPRTRPQHGPRDEPTAEPGKPAPGDRIQKRLDV